MTELKNWLRDGQHNWELLEKHGELTIPWNNPWYRFAMIAFVGLVLLLVGIKYPGLIALGLGIIAIGGGTALYFFLKEHRVGGVAAWLSTKGCAIGCGRDRLFIPWSAIAEGVGGTSKIPINEQYMIIPLNKEGADQIVIQARDGSTVQWDGKPYKRAIIRAELHMPDEGIRIYVFPNEIMVHFLTVLYPIIAYRIRSAPAGSNTDNKDAVSENLG